MVPLTVYYLMILIIYNHYIHQYSQLRHIVNILFTKRPLLFNKSLLVDDFYQALSKIKPDADAVFAAMRHYLHLEPQRGDHRVFLLNI